MRPGGRLHIYIPGDQYEVATRVLRLGGSLHPDHSLERLPDRLFHSRTKQPSQFEELVFFHGSSEPEKGALIHGNGTEWLGEHCNGRGSHLAARRGRLLRAR